MPYCYECKTEVLFDDVDIDCKNGKCICLRCVLRLAEASKDLKRSVRQSAIDAAGKEQP